MESSREELLRELNKIELLVRGNPCGMKDITFKSLLCGIKVLVSKDFHTDMSLEQVALYFGVTTRTINTWQRKYGFPRGKQIGHHELSFSAEEILEWKESHEDVVG